MNKIIAAAFGIAVALAPLSAQAAPRSTTPTTVKVGGFFPNSSTATKNGGSTLLSAGIDCVVNQTAQTADASSAGACRAEYKLARPDTAD